MFYRQLHHHYHHHRHHPHDKTPTLSSSESSPWSLSASTLTRHVVPISKTYFLRHFASLRLHQHHQHHQYHQHRRHYIINIETIIIITRNTNLGIDIFVQNQRKELGYILVLRPPLIYWFKSWQSPSGTFIQSQKKRTWKPVSFKSLNSIKLHQKLTIILTIIVSWLVNLNKWRSRKAMALPCAAGHCWDQETFYQCHLVVKI